MAAWDACTLEPNSWIRWIECHPSTAAWVQAVFIVLALAVAIAVPSLQDTIQRRKRGAQIKARVRLIARMASDTLKAMLEDTDQGLVTLLSERKVAIWGDLAARVNAVPLEDVTSDEVQIAIISLTIILRDAAELHRQWPENHSQLAQMEELKKQIDTMLSVHLR